MSEIELKDGMRVAFHPGNGPFSGHRTLKFERGQWRGFDDGGRECFSGGAQRLADWIKTGVYRLVKPGLTEAQQRKAKPLATGCIDYFPDALLAVAELSRIGNEQHNPGQPLHWDRGKSTDEADALMRHFLDRGKLDTDGVRHSAKVAWRALALLQKELEAANG